MRLWSRWTRGLTRREGAESLALARILAASTVFSSLLGVWTRGVAHAAWVDVAYGGMRKLDASWVAWFGGMTPANVTALLALGLVASAMMTVGAFTRASSIVTYVVFRTLAIMNPVMRDSSDRLLISVLLLLMLSGAGRAISVDAWLRKKTGDVPVWPRYVAILQLVVMYVMTAAQKISSGWVPGGPLDALWFIFQQPSWQRLPMRWVAPYFPVTQAMTLGTWVFEWLSPVFLGAIVAEESPERGGAVRRLLRRVRFRNAYLGAGVLLHLGITACMDINQFLGGVMAIYALCIPPREWRALYDRASEALRRRASAPSAP